MGLATTPARSVPPKVRGATPSQRRPVGGCPLVVIAAQGTDGRGAAPSSPAVSSLDDGGPGVSECDRREVRGATDHARGPQWLRPAAGQDIAGARSNQPPYIRVC